jgi:hypothetical protein
MTIRMAAVLCVIGAPTVWAEMCIPAPTLTLRDPKVIELIGVPTGGGVEAGAGPIRPVDENDRPLRHLPKVLGYVVRTHRVHADFVGRVGMSAPTDSLEVVLVPWSANASCGPMVPAEQRHALTEKRALFFGQLRERKHWVAGKPTIDLLTPGPNVYRGGEYGGADSAPTPDQLLDLSEAMPIYPIRTPTDTSHPELRALRRWMREHPSLRARAPVRSIVALELMRAEERRIRGSAHAVAGTWRFHLLLSPRDSVALVARSDAKPTQPIWSFDSNDNPFWTITDKVPRADGFVLYYQFAPSARALRTTRGVSDDDWRITSAFEIAERPAVATPDSTVWRSKAMHLHPILALTRRMTLPAASRAARDSLSAQLAREELTSEARVVRLTDGVMRFEGTILRAGVPVARVRGRRVSTATFRNPEYSPAVPVGF